MTHISDALAAEIGRLLAVRDLTAAARHLMELEPGADAVNFNATFDKHGMALDVAFLRSNAPIGGFGQ
jgi:hypothetical protein